MTGLRHSHLTNINPCQCWVCVCKDRYQSLSIWAFWLVIANFFADETTVFTLHFGNFLLNESGCFTTSRTRGCNRVRCYRWGTAVARVGGTLIAINPLCICVRVGARVCVCFSVVSIPSKVSDGCSDLNIFQVLVCLLTLLGILMNICKSRHVTCHSLEEQ